MRGVGFSSLEEHPDPSYWIQDMVKLGRVTDHNLLLEHSGGGGRLFTGLSLVSYIQVVGDQILELG